MKQCSCKQPHERKRVVLTGGPGGGKTAVLEMIRLHFCEHVRVLPEGASIVFGGGFPRGAAVGPRQAVQRAIFHVQRELEAVADAEEPAIVVCDRGTVDGGAYWAGSGDLWTSVGTTLNEEMHRYSVIHLRSPNSRTGYNHLNPLRLESAEDAAVIDARIFEIWKSHPRVFVVEASQNFFEKARRALGILQGEMPDCCKVDMGRLDP